MDNKELYNLFYKDNEEDNVEKLTADAIKQINNLPISETDRQLRLQFLDYVILKLRQSRYEGDEEDEEKWLRLVQRLTREDFSHVTSNLETELFIEKEKDNLEAVMTMFKDKISSSFKLSSEDKSNYLRLIDDIRKQGHSLLKQGDLKAYNRFIAESIDRIWQILGSYFAE